MWRRVFLPVVLVMLFVSSFPFIAHAQSTSSYNAQRPAQTISCYGCQEDQQWPPSSTKAYGGRVVVGVSSPSTTSGNDYWYRGFLESQATSAPYVFVDIENGANAPCVKSYGAGTYYRL